MLTIYALSKLSKENEQTWVNLQKRLNEVQFSYEKLFTNQDVHRFIKKQGSLCGNLRRLFHTFTFHNNCLPPCIESLPRSNVNAQPAPKSLHHLVGYPGTGKYIVCFPENSLSQIFYKFSTFLKVVIGSSVIDTLVFFVSFQENRPQYNPPPKIPWKS